MPYVLVSAFQSAGCAMISTAPAMAENVASTERRSRTAPRA